MFDKLYEFIIHFLKYLQYGNSIKKNSSEDDNMSEILIKYDEIYNIENPFIL